MGGGVEGVIIGIGVQDVVVVLMDVVTVEIEIILPVNVLCYYNMH